MLASYPFPEAIRSYKLFKTRSQSFLRQRYLLVLLFKAISNSSDKFLIHSRHVVNERTQKVHSHQRKAVWRRNFCSSATSGQFESNGIIHSFPGLQVDFLPVSKRYLGTCTSTSRFLLQRRPANPRVMRTRRVSHGGGRRRSFGNFLISVHQLITR